MSDPKRGSLITVGAPKSAKNKVTKTVRLTINLDESNESKYPELNYKELVSAEEKKKRVVNGKTPGLDPFSDNDDDVEKVARKFEQKYGGKSTYGKKGDDEFADIGAGYDENDPFIDNTDGYDEMIPPECDTIYGGFYINCGSLEFKTASEGERQNNKRRISSCSSESESSESSTESESQEERDTKTANGADDGHDTEHRKKKINNNDKKKAKKIRRTDSSAATSGKQTSDENVHGDAESADSRTSQSDSVASKPAPSSENAITSDSSRDVEASEVKLPEPIVRILDELQANVKRQSDNKAVSPDDATKEQLVLRLQTALSDCRATPRATRAAWERAARILNTSRVKLLRSLRLAAKQTPAPTQQNAQPNPATATAKPVSNKRKSIHEDKDMDSFTEQEREAMIEDTLERLKELIEEKTPSMLANYQAECERVQEERRKIQMLRASEGAPHIEKRLPKRRFPWCNVSRALLVRLATLARAPANTLAQRALPLFPSGFVRMPALLRQAGLSKEPKESAAKRPRLNSCIQPQAQPAFTEPIHFPSSLTVTASVKPSPEKNEPSDKKPTSLFSSINSFMSKDLIIEKPEKREEKPKEDLYIPPNNIGSITITAVSNPPKASEKKSNSTAVVNTEKKEGLIRVKTPALLNNTVKKELEKLKKSEKMAKEKRLETPLHIETNYPINKKLPSPNLKKLPSPSVKDEITKKQIENMRVIENNLPRPVLVPVHHSPTFAKPDKRPPEVKKKKDLVIISDVDPLSDNQEPVNVDDSSSDVEVVEEKTDKSEPKSEVPSNSVFVREPSENKCVSASECVNKERLRDGHKSVEEATNDDFEMVMRNIKEMSNSQETSKLCNSFEGVIKNAKRDTRPPFTVPEMYKETDENKFAERASLNKMDGFRPVTG